MVQQSHLSVNKCSVTITNIYLMASKVIITENGLENQNVEHFVCVHFTCLELNVKV